MKKAKENRCIVCGRFLSDDPFDERRICDECMKLSPEVREEKQIITRINSLPTMLTKQHKKWLNELRKDKRDNIRKAAENAYAAKIGVQQRHQWKMDEVDEILDIYDEDEYEYDE